MGSDLWPEYLLSMLTSGFCRGVRNEPHDDLRLGHRRVGCQQAVCDFLTHTLALAKPHCCGKR